MDVPKFDDLPPVQGMPKGCAWGVFDRDGNKDVFGTLNHLTPDVVKAAAAEVKDGVSISLDWPLDAMDHLPMLRRKLTHTVYLAGGGEPRSAYWDDELSFNTQGSSQWDSLVHWPYQPTGQVYNGARPTAESLSLSTGERKPNPLPTLEHWHRRGGLVGRGVLIDFKTYADEKGISFDPLGLYRISVEEIEAVAAHQGVEFRPGDVFLLRTGATEALDHQGRFSMEKMADLKLPGVHGDEAAARWFWDRRFSAVACDTGGFEAYPPLKDDGTAGMLPLVLHKYFLAFFGMPIGEYWDLTNLARYCKQTGRYSFMLTSQPLNVPGLVGSPPNALAIF
ncbi:hypothetical protein SODALDRAFT_400797 [Sodiomyces alkalinus F11]|uniref:Cyclase n=1 Tax=Sodiomyces alkalinus (strain CBS 110278 / VKM F-3762 / F11) TaxID=1314773 RepID=A0A3N2PRL2_SODAK|nr:hypothetical protein SODALDRAFT_400797 [Sodiomyces alkalinus F11]ROT37110.1 hypothetical protein SODALDRAFT_400797 [Sodiomyces alkalinus F11]